MLIPLSLYIHIPWCIKKCPYCDFNSHSDKDIPEKAYIAALKKDLLTEKPFSNGRKLTSIFIGGGTPSLFSAESISEILDFAEREIGFADNIEITLEANPGTAEQQRFAGYRQAGINRLSMGVQSFNDLHLQKLGRIHSSDNAKQAFSMARQAGFDNINLDLMHGLPGQSITEAMSDLESAFELTPEHLSWYQLTIEPNTAFYSAPPVLPHDETLIDIQEQGQKLLAKNGYQQYEVSAYCKNAQQSQHNLNYWQFGDYLAIGAGAHGKYSQVTNDNALTVHRRNKTRQPSAYLSRTDHFTAQQSTIEPEDLPLEFMMNALRLSKGVPRDYFQQRTGLDFSVVAPILSQLQQQSLISSDSQRIGTTAQGLLFLNNILEKFDP